MDDLISRQAVIDIAKDLIITINGYEQYNQAVNNYSAKIMQLPPAQPKIIQCKDCKEYDPIYTGGAGVCGHWNAKTESNVYCAYAERKTE